MIPPDTKRPAPAAELSEQGPSPLFQKKQRVRICANKVVAGVRCSTLLPNIRPQDTRQFASAQQINQLEGLAVAIPWGFESPLPHQTSLACQAERASSRQASSEVCRAVARRAKADSPHIRIWHHPCERVGMDERRAVYDLRSERDPARHYVGLTADVHSRLADHNSGGSAHTARYRPWRLAVSIEFETQDQAAEFERYLKSGSGRAFAKRHFERRGPAIIAPQAARPCS